SGDNRTDLAIASIHRPEGTGLVGEYFDDPALTSRNFTRLDAGVGFDWGLGGPPGLDPDSFSVRWSGLLLCNESGDHTFIVDADDGMRLWVDGRLLVDRWEGGPVHASATVFLPEGYHDLRAEYHDATFRAYAYVNWSTPYSSGPIPAYNLVPSMASPVSIVEGTWNLSSLNVSRILIEDGRGVALGSALLNTSNGLFIGSWSLGRVHRYDETTEGTVAHYTAVPHTKGSGDETGEDIDDLRRDDGDYYEVERDSDADDLVIDTFDVSSIDPLALEHGTIVSVVLKVGYYTDQYYAQWGSRNYVQYAKEGETYADSDIRPYLTTTEVEETFDLYGHGVTTIDDIEDLDIHFNNADGGWVKDSVFFDYIVIDIGIEAPYLSETVRGPPSFGMALASDDQALYVGAPCAGPVDLESGPLGMLGGGIVYSVDLGNPPEDVADAGSINGAQYSGFGMALACDGGDLAVGAPWSAYGAISGAVYLLDDMELVGSGLMPYVNGSAGRSLAMSGDVLAAGNPAIDTVHVINLTDLPSLDAGDLRTVFAPGMVTGLIDITTDTPLNLTTIALPGWNASVNGSAWMRTDQGPVVIDVAVDTPAPWSVPVVVVGRAPDGLACAIDHLMIRALSEHTEPLDLFVQRRDDRPVQPPGHPIAYEESMLMPLIYRQGPDGPPVNVTISDGGTYLNRSVVMPADVLQDGSTLSARPYGLEVWNGSWQGGPTEISTNVGYSHASWRVIVRGEYLEQRAQRIRLKFYSPISLLFDEVAIACPSPADTRDVIDDTWHDVTFGGHGYHLASAGEVFVSDWIDMEMVSERNYTVTFHTSTRGTHRVTFWTGNGVFGTHGRIGVDYRRDLDWSDDTVDSWNLVVFLMGIEAQERAVVLVRSSALRSNDGWTGISWTAETPGNTYVLAQIRTAPDIGGTPGNWTKWHGPLPDDFYEGPSTLTESDPWLQYSILLVT
ncbi:MAG TPA: hypothetical protein EYP43_04860, partial [Thermoplasmata archaeon]|nr:hypothetical protein [Thermoplasmata archaeon]